MQVLTDELDELKRRRAQLRADGRELARQEKNMKKRRTRLMQACLSSAEPSQSLEDFRPSCVPGSASIEPG